MVTEVAPRPAAAAVDTAEAAPRDSLRRVLVARVLPAVAERLRADGRLAQEEASAAIDRALADVPSTAGANDASTSRSDRQHGATRSTTPGLRLVALTLPAPLYDAVAAVARASFDGEITTAAGWLLARGLGVQMTLPTAERPAPERAQASVPARVPPPVAARAPAQAAAPFSVTPAAERPAAERRASVVTRPPKAAPASPRIVVDAPTAEALREHRERIGLSQKEVAAAAGLSRGLVAEVERGRRANSLTRLRISETLASLERST